MCRYCSKIYTRKWSLTTHVQREHEFDQNPLRLYCTCGMTFQWSSTLYRHKKKCGIHQRAAEINYEAALSSSKQNEDTTEQCG